jgi:hypothetical protein
VIGVDALHCIDDLEALHDLTEVVVLRRQTDAAGPTDEEELAAVGVRPALAMARNRSGTSASRARR